MKIQESDKIVLNFGMRQARAFEGLLARYFKA